jgi:hypothetical protein
MQHDSEPLVKHYRPPDPAPGQIDSSDGSGGPAPEIGGRAGPEPTRFGDWEKNGRCIDF